MEHTGLFICVESEPLFWRLSLERGFFACSLVYESSTENLNNILLFRNLVDNEDSYALACIKEC